jgi:hypothetical protein
MGAEGENGQKLNATHGAMAGSKENQELARSPTESVQAKMPVIAGSIQRKHAGVRDYEVRKT